jgi:hypothetical protein
MTDYKLLWAELLYDCREGSRDWRCLADDLHDWLSAKGRLDIWEAADQPDPIIDAQHDETGRMWRGPRSQLPRRFAEVTAHQPEAGLLAQIADVAHCGGLADLSERDALITVRRLTLPHWNRSGGQDEMRQRVGSALRTADQQAACTRIDAGPVQPDDYLHARLVAIRQRYLDGLARNEPANECAAAMVSLTTGNALENCQSGDSQ